MTLTGGNLNINSGASVSTTATGVIDWSADATLSGAGTLNVASGGTLNFSGSGTRYIGGGTLNNSGTINWSGGNNLSIYDSGVINNLAAGLFLVTNDQIIYFHCCAGGQAFNNAGTFRKTTATEHDHDSVQRLQQQRHRRHPERHAQPHLRRHEHRASSTPAPPGRSSSTARPTRSAGARR